MVFINMKTLNIDSPVAQRLAQVALFERIQAALNLDTAMIVKTIRRHAPDSQVDRLRVAGDLYSMGPILLQSILEAVSISIRTGTPISGDQIRSIVRTDFAHSICDTLKWYPFELVDGIKSKAESEGFDPAKAAEYLVGAAPEVAIHVFANVIAILKRDKK
jgi:hypothetical protein